MDNSINAAGINGISAAVTAMETTTTTMSPPLFIGVGGGSSCGKNQVCKLIMESLQSRKLQGQVIILRHLYTLNDIDNEE